ncbi:hypothetical protein LAG90_15740 [Marinilongibacter aquaticus]|uniref:hypothetical protein n=1 Tax=Marinilongibacter aquaticus TaxID=2975157 RepID=UPI0021BD06D9|nr:hypothetical protein [Marinilongibacter aquaticus]UBM58256.1 hypothetical protein LAG90_15740 [Marinilongibacter aquaticus]
MKQTIEIPVRKVIKQYLLHPYNLGPSPVIEKRHWLGRMFVSVASAIPFVGSDLPVDEYEKDVSDYDILKIDITFRFKREFLTQHHLLALSMMLDSVFELALMNFCRGRFTFAPSYHAAVEDFFERYSLYEVDVDGEYYRRFIHKKYGALIKKELKTVGDLKLQKVLDSYPHKK